MTYDFTTVIDRRGHDSLAADKIPFEGVAPEAGFDPIPMWIADMAFPVAPCVLDAVRARLDMPCLGYFALPEEYYGAIISWQARRNGAVGLKNEHIGYENGVLGGVSSAVQAFSSPGDKILLHSPTYIGFTHTLNDLGRVIVHSPLVRDENGVWRMDYEDMDKKLRENDIHLAVFCSPHNPSGRVWEREEIERAMEIYRKNDCVVISDEIWSDIIFPGYKHIPTQSVSADARERTVAFYAPSKTFSLAGLVGSYHIIYNKYLRDRVNRVSEMSHYNDANVLSMRALVGAYSPEGEAWCDEMRAVIAENARIACDFFAEAAPGIRIMRPQGTYMLYLDCAEYCAAHGISITELEHRGVRCGVIWQDGEAFIWPNTIRMNLALPQSRLVEALDRLKKYVFA